MAAGQPACVCQDPDGPGVATIVACDRRGAIHTGREDYEAGTMSVPKHWLAEPPPLGAAKAPARVIEGTTCSSASRPVMTKGDLKRMNPDRFVFAMANPNPRCARGGPAVRVMATGRSDYPNQINNVLAFPGIFRGALDVRPAISPRR